MQNIISYNGISNQQLGVYVTKLPTIPVPIERAEEITIPGRNGSLWRSYGVYDPIDIPVELFVPPECQTNSVVAWLTGQGDLIIGSTTGLAYEARVVGDCRLTPCPFADGWLGVATFRCQPFRKIGGDPMIIRASGVTVNNPYPVYSEPLITVTGTGTATVSIGDQEFTITGMSGMYSVDTALQECFNGTRLCNNQMQGVFPVLPPGPSVITFSGVSMITLSPRWRTL